MKQRYRPPFTPLLVPALCLLACNGGDAEGTESLSGSATEPTGASATTPTASTTASTTAGSASATGTTTTSGSASMSASSSGSTMGIKYDLAAGDDLSRDTDVPPPSCKVVDDMNAVGDCSMEAPPDSFDPEIQWTWGDGGSDGGSTVTPLVANLTDDNDDGEIDLCDIPDVVVVAGNGPFGASIYVLDGATGAEHFKFGNVDGFVTPAIGDIDGDGLPEIIAATPGGFINPQSAVVAFEHDGTVKWTSVDKFNHDQGGAIALADLDNDGTVEIIVDDLVLDDQGEMIFMAPEQVGWQIVHHCTATAVADLDGDGDLEVILGQAAYHHDGTEYYNHTEISPGFPQVANLDGDAFPEILIANYEGLTIIDDDGSIKIKDFRPTGDPVGSWFRPATVHDFDGDEVSEFATSSATHYGMYEPGTQIVWTADVQDGSGWATGTAFDFDGDGIAEAMYADESTLYVFDGEGKPLLAVPRSSKTLIEYPVVADVDNDGSAEIIVVSSADFDDNQTSPTVQVIRDKEDRWIQARRIWNQHTYHVTNVREDSTIPQWEPSSSQILNTYRTNAQIEGGALCKPKPPT